MPETHSIERRDFLKGAAALGLSFMALAEELHAAEPAPADAPQGPPVNVGIIGLGPQGRDILSNLGRQPLAQTVAICDTYEPYVTRSKENAPKATTYSDYKKLLDQKDVEAVFVATPTHQHKQIVLDALQAGKHVYCEAPLAMTVEEAKAIASAGQTSKQVFAAGLQYRSNPIHDHAQSFAKAGVMADLAEGYGQYHKKQSWRRAAPNAERANEINWRLSKATSSGLMGEIGVHQVDIANWFINALPVSVMGVGSIRHWNDGRDVDDTVHCILEYPKEIRFDYDVTLVNSFGASFEQFLGSDAALILKDLRAWMVKETDAPLLGWEVYARKEPVSDDMGIVLVANATKILAAGADPAKATVDKDKSPLYYAVEDFVTSIKTRKKPNAGPEEGYRATVTAIKSNDAVVSGSKVTFQKEWFDLA